MNGINTNPQTINYKSAPSFLTTKAKLLSLTILFTAGIGVWICGSLVKVHDGGWQVNTENATLLAMPCITSTDNTSSCGYVTSSRWGSFDFFVGNRHILIPASLIGIIYFLAIILWFTLQPTPMRWTHRQWTATLMVQSCAMLASMFWLVVMVKHVHGWCTDCLVAHMANAIIFASTIWLRQCVLHTGSSTYSSAQPQPHTSYGLSPAMTAMSIAFVGFGVWLYYDATTSARHYWRRQAVLEKLTNSLQEDPSFVLREFYAQPINSALNTANDNPLTAATASHNDAHLTVFTNYESRASRCFEATLGGHIRDAFGNRISVDFRHLPKHASPIINDQSEWTGIHSSLENASCQAAVAAYEEGGFRAFAAMRTKLFVDRKHHTQTDIARMARSIGLDQEDLLARMQSPDVIDRIESDMSLAEHLGVHNAPAAYLNGRRVPALCLNSEVFWKTIALKMTAQASATMSQ